MTVKILALCGSARRGSVNRKLLDVAVRGAGDSGAEVRLVSLADHSLPFYDGDFEQEYGMPAAARELQRLLAEHDALLVASPEYNGGYTALLKNAIDWISRPMATGESGVQLFQGKVAAVISASPGPMGGIRSMLGMRGVLEKLGMLVIPQGFSLAAAHQAFDADGGLIQKPVETEVRAVGARLVETARGLSKA
ncbi:NADPH-dependent FMN reductase [Cupriavidus consociatus]|uniref:NADPH-dependent FMN reductase n=1 Tax=Cupriavidus consociatus TaxID=2821357 RepID=UPI001AE43A16|nr:MULTISPECIES: NAD(P)H-dependent oxidoreductase [unclassified Cupriavidus]MBP0622419.1 NAD(P)H-dependent oxidoreductase [Cupriavidus sp. LEh25]MDK2659106.1 NAD(P)H-dependent oxidoreductase [Cupriavidus sp. LEh21]